MGIFVRKKIKGAPYRYQSFADSVYEMTMQGAKTGNNPGAINHRNLIYRFKEVLEKMRTGFLNTTSTLPSSTPVLSRKTSKRKGNEGKPLIKHHVGVSLEEKDCLTIDNYSKTIRNYFEKYHLGVGTVHIIFSDCLSYDLYFDHCDQIFSKCATETEYILTLHNSLRVFNGSYATSPDGFLSKET